MTVQSNVFDQSSHAAERLAKAAFDLPVPRPGGSVSAGTPGDAVLWYDSAQARGQAETLLSRLARDTGTAVVCSTHDPLVIEQVDTEIRLG